MTIAQVSYKIKTKKTRSTTHEHITFIHRWCRCSDV